MFLTVLAGGIAPLRAQEALVLSAGGSRGLAHVGVLMALDSLKRDPDIVVGASMGAIVGALYAAGRSGEDIRRMVTRQDWDDLFKEAPLLLGPDRAARVPTWRWAVTLKGFEFSRGLKPDWRANRLLVQLLADAGIRARGDFDRLPRRFRAVTTDFRTGKEVVLAEGSLARAVRASFALPGFFSPIVWHDRVLADGGIADYLPVSVARELGAETVIAIDVLRPKSEIGRKDPLGLALRGLGLVTVNAHPEFPKPDILVFLDVPENLDGLVFPPNAAPLIEKASRAALDSIPPKSTGGRRIARQQPSAPDSLSTVVIETPDPAIAALARRVFRRAAPARYDFESLLHAADKLYATGVATGVWLRVNDAANVAATDSTFPRHPGVSNGEVSLSSPRLVVTVDPPPRVETAVAAGYDNDRGGRVWGALVGRLPTKRSPLELELSASTNGLASWGALGIRRHSLAAAPLRWSGGVDARKTDAPFFPFEFFLIDPRVERAGGWLGIELPHIYPDWILSATVRGERVRILDDDTIADNGNRGGSWGPQLRFTIPTAAVDVWPTEVELEARFGDVAYRRAAARGLLGAKWGGTEVAAAGDFAFVSNDAPPDVVPSLGDYGAMPGFRWGEDRGRTRIVTGVDVSRALFPWQGRARLRLRVGAATDGTDELSSSHTWVTGAGIGGVWSLPLASLYVGVGVNSRGRQRLDISLGPRF